MEAGHPEAKRYPLGYLFDEVQLVEDRRNGIMVSEATLIQGAIMSVLSAKGGKVFAERIEKLTEG